MRAARDSGSPCSVLDLIASTSASESVQSTMRALMVHSPRSFATSRLKTVQTVDNARAAFLDQDRRELHRPGGIGKQPDVSGIRSFLTQVEPGHKQAYRNADLRQLLDHAHGIGIIAICDGCITHS